MPYIGNTIRAADDYRLIDDISSSFNGSTTSFALQVAGSAPVPFPKSPQQVLISVNGVIQEPDPTGSSGFNLVGTNIVFSSAPTNGHAFFGIIYATADYLNSGGNFPSGSLGSPSITFVGDEDTGIYRKGSGSVGFVSNSTEIANTDSNGITISSGNLILGDSSGSSSNRIKLGASGDLAIYHDGSHSRIDETGTGNLMIQSNNAVFIKKGTAENIATFNADGAVELFFDNAKKAETVTGGFTVTGVCTATSFAGDGSSLSGINTDLVSDTSPQLGGNLDVNTKNINFGDSSGSSDDRLTFGAAGDLQIYHDGTDTAIVNSTGDLYITNNGDDLLLQALDDVVIKTQGGADKSIECFGNGAVEIYHNNVKKLETTGSGIAVSATVDNAISGSFTNNGTTGGHGIKISSGGTGGGSRLLDIESHNQASAKTRFQVTADGHVIIPTDSPGTGEGRLQIGAGQDLELFHGGTNSFIRNTTGYLQISSEAGDVYMQSNGNVEMRPASGETGVKAIANGAVELYHNNAKKLDTAADRVNITGHLFINTGARLYIQNGFQDSFGSINNTGGSNDSNLNFYVRNAGTEATALKIQKNSNIELPIDNQKLSFGASQDLEIFHDGDNNYIKGINNDFIYIATNSTNRWSFANDGHFRPEANNTYDIGSTSQRVRNIYTNDLHLSNEGSSNDIDSTWGDWTIQEGESDLFLKNNRSGKKYKFNLTEVA